MPTTVRFLGAAQEVTGSMHLVETTAGRLLIDCGMYQGRREESRARNAHLPPEAIAADAVILTHAHIDHSGSLPTLVKSGFRGRIYGTPADARSLPCTCCATPRASRCSDAEYLNRQARRRSRLAPDRTDLRRERRHRSPAPLRLRPLRSTLRAAPRPARARSSKPATSSAPRKSHLDVPDGATTRRLVFSGDLGRKDLPILRDPAPLDRADYLFMESTYGDRIHAPIQAMEDQLAKIVVETVAEKGKVIIPAFAVGRTQEIVYALHKLAHRRPHPATCRSSSTARSP